jgi:hypothetical protein
MPQLNTQERAIIVAMAKKGMSPKSIAESVKCSVTTVRKWIKRDEYVSYLHPVRTGRGRKRKPCSAWKGAGKRREGVDLHDVPPKPLSFKLPTVEREEQEGTQHPLPGASGSASLVTEYTEPPGDEEEECGWADDEFEDTKDDAESVTSHTNECDDDGLWSSKDDDDEEGGEDVDEESEQHSNDSTALLVTYRSSDENSGLQTD